MKGRSRAARVAVAIAALFLGGCAGGAPATPTVPSAPVVTPRPAPTPSPTPDPVALAVAQFAAKDMRAHVVLDGTADYGGTTVTSSGTMDMIAEREHETYETKVGGEVVETKEVISIGQDEWERINAGPWHDSDGTNDTPLVADLAGLISLTVVGMETVAGEQLIHVRPGPGVNVDQKGWGPSDPSVTDYTIALDLWIRPDGSLAKLTQDEQWKVPSGTTTTVVKTTADETFSPLAASATIAEPDDAWVANVSKAMGYTVSQPAGYQVKSGDGGDSFVVGDQVLLSVAASSIDAGMTLEEALIALTESYEKQAKAELLMAYDARVDGHAAKVAVFKAKDSAGNDLRLVDAVTVVGDRLWEIYRVGTPDTVTDDVDHVNKSLTTFELSS
jgi:hypothetical protein